MAGSVATAAWSDGPALGWPLGGASHSQVTGGTSDGAGRLFFITAGSVMVLWAANSSLGGLVPGTFGGSFTNAVWDPPTASLVCISAATGGRNVTRLYPNGTRAWLAGTGASGSAAGPLAAATFLMGGSGSGYTPGLAVNASSGDIFLADAHGIRVLRLASGTASGPIAGSAAGTPGAADGLGTACLMNAPVALVLTGVGGSSGSGGAATLWVAERDNHVVRALALQGGAAPALCATAAGALGQQGMMDGLGPAARLSAPNAMAYSAPQNTLYIAEYTNSAVRTLHAATLAVGTLAGAPGAYVPGPFLDGPRGTGTTYRPQGLVLDSGTGLLFMPDWNYAVRTVSLATGELGTATGSGNWNTGGAGNFYGTGRSAAFSSPAGVALDAASGTVYVADAGNALVRAVAIGTVRTVAGSPNPNWVGYNANSAGSLGVWTRATVIGAAVLTAQDAASGDGLLMTYTYCCSNVLYRYRANSSLTPVAGSGGGAAPADGTGAGAVWGFNNVQPQQLLYTAATGLGFIAEPASNSIRVFSLNGTVGTLAGASRAAGLLNVDGSPAAPSSSALFSAPGGLALLPDGTLAVSDAGNHRLRALLSSGAGAAPGSGGVVTVAGNGAAAWVNGVGAGAALNRPGPLCWDPATASLLLLDVGNWVVRRVTSLGNLTGNVSALAGRGSSPAATGADGTGAAVSFSSSLTSIVCSGSGSAYLTEGAGVLRRLDAATGAVVTVAGAFGATALLDGLGALARLGTPSGLSLDASGAPVFCDGLHVRRFDPASGAVTTLLSLAAAVLQAPTGIAFDAARRRVYVSEPGPGKISAIDPATGAVTRLAGSLGGAPRAQGLDGPALAPFSGFASPRALAVDAAAACVYISDASARSVRRYNATSGTVDFFIGSPSGGGIVHAPCSYPAAGAAGTSALLSSPAGLAFNGSGALLVVDSGMSCLLSLRLGAGGGSAGGAVTALAGACGCMGYVDGPPASARFSLGSFTSGLVPDPSWPGAFLVTDLLNNLVRRVLGNGSVVTAAGSGAAVTADGPLGTGATLRPLALAIPPSNAARPYQFALLLEQGAGGGGALRILHLPNGTLGTLVSGGTASFADGPPGAARFNFGFGGSGAGVGAGLAMDSNLTAYLADFNSHRVRAVLFPSGNVSTLLGTGTPGCAGGVAGGGSSGSGIATTAFPVALAFSAASSSSSSSSSSGGGPVLYLADSCGLRAISLGTGPGGSSVGGAVRMLAGTGLPNFFQPGYPVAGLRGYDAGSALGATFAAPLGLALAPDGSALFIADSGVVGSVAGGGGRCGASPWAAPLAVPGSPLW